MSANVENARDQPADADFGTTELVVSESTARVIRAGYSNAALVIAPTISVVVGMLARQAGAGSGAQVLAGVIVGALVLLRYSRSVSRIRIDDETIHFTCPIHVESIRFADLEYVRLGCIGGSMTASVEAKREGHLLSASFHYIAPATSWGDIALSQHRLESILKAKGVPIRAPRLIYKRIGLPAKKASSM